MQHGRTSVWVDAGTGTLAELQRHVSLDSLDAIWISHAHADHSADLLTAYYALRFSELAPAGPVPLIVPPNLVDRLVTFLGPGAVKTLPKVFDITQMGGFGELVIGDLALEWGPVDHGMPAYALRITGGGASVAYSGDTAPCGSLVELAAGATLLLCEAGYDVAPPSNGVVHCTPEDAARIATTAGAHRLLLTHVDAGIADAAGRAAKSFAGSVGIAIPGQVISLA
ncbi:MAG: beta-lactamase domain protein [Microbacteriaceae bacterium]|nr:beta-lactamase domain protein [Microbacteriaceae bacterium]